MPATATPPARDAKKTTPQVWTLQTEAESLDIIAPAEGDTGRRVRAVLYTGAAVTWMWGEKFIIDLASVTIPAGPIPMLSQHDARERIGVWDKVWIENNQVWGEGRLLDNARAADIAADAAGGFPFETSLGIAVETSYLDKGLTADLNGRTIEGPACIGRNGRVREASLCVLGADPDTTSVIFQQPEPRSMQMSDTPATDTAELESVAVEDITADWLRENKPDLVKAIVEAAADDDAGAEPAPETAEMAQPATLAELKALKVDSDSVIWALEHKVTLAHAKATFAFAERRVAALESAGAEPVPGRGATPPAATTTAALAEDPAKAWADSEPLRNYWKDRGGQGAFMQFAQLAAAERTDWRADLPDFATT